MGMPTCIMCKKLRTSEDLRDEKLKVKNKYKNNHKPGRYLLQKCFWCRVVMVFVKHFRKFVLKMVISSDVMIMALFILLYVIPAVTGQDFSKLPNFCPIDKTLPKNASGNGYFCPDIYDDGSPNPYTECFHNDRPDALGNYHSCCKPNKNKEKEKWAKVEFIAIYIGVATACLIFILIIYVYCRKDTLKWLDGCTKKTRYRKDRCLDGLCMCCCCRNRVTETEKYKLNHVTPVRNELTTNTPIATEDPLFWNPDTNEFY